MPPLKITYQQGFTAPQLNKAIQLYDQAFGAKLGLGIPEPEKRLTFLRSIFNPTFSLVALHEGQVVGIAGFQTPAGSLTGGIMNFSTLRRQLGWLGSVRAALIFSLYERTATPGELLMDGLAVDSAYRGQGIGGRLLQEIIAYGQANGYHHVRLDVIDTNPRAKKLYQRQGFQTIKEEHYPFLRPLLGFGGSTEMHYPLQPPSS